MKNIFILHVLLLITIFQSSAQDTISLWPIAGQIAGKNILYKPQDFIGEELNSDNLFIAAPEGTPVLAPITGWIDHISYDYSKSMRYSCGFNILNAPKKNISEYDKQQRQNYAEKNHINPDFVSLEIGISKGKGEKYYITGLRPYAYFKTGEKVNKGDTLGFVGYCYKEIPQPSICLTRSINTLSADPMSPFGLKSKFIASKREQINAEIPISKLIADVDTLKQALEEGHPGLYDYTTKANMDATFDSIRKKINHPMYSGQFLRLLKTITDSIRDYHTYIYNNLSAKSMGLKPLYVDLPVNFGFQNDSLMICQTLPDYKNLLGKHIVKINNDSASVLLKHNTIPYIAGDGYNNVKQSMGLLLYFFDYRIQFKHVKGDSVTIFFDDNTKACFTYQEIKNDALYPQRIFHNQDKLFEIKYIDNNTAYLRIKTFKLTNTQQDSICCIMRKLCHSAYRNLVLDIRDNGGGHNQCITELFSFFAEEPFSDYLETKVNSNSKYEFLKNTSNLDPNAILFPEYKKIEGKDGYYAINNERFMPNDSNHFQGNVYLLVNENTGSAASIFAALMHKYKRGKIIGRETGTCYYQMNAHESANVYLQNSGLEINIPLVKVIFDSVNDNTIPWGHGVIPDHQINWTFDEWFNISDPILNYTVNLIQKTVSK